MKSNQFVSSPSTDTLHQTIHALKTMLLSIYNEILITDIDGIILERAGSINGLWEASPHQMVGSSLLELEKRIFLEEPSMKELLKKKKTSTLQTSWNGKKILMTIIPVSTADKSELLIWALRDLNEDRLKEASETDLNNTAVAKLASPLVAHSPKMIDVLHTAEMVSVVSSTVLLLGESGVGKEVIAKAIHEMGTRKNEPFVAVNCGAIPENLLESELFGYEEGAFSGAKKSGARGKFEIADKGVLFLDEIAEMPLGLQVKLLRALQEREITPLGGSQPKKIDIQVIAATNKSLEQMVEDGKFREDLYYRLNVVPIHIPSLRERIEEIPHFIYYFTQKYNQMYQKQINILPDAVDLLSIYPWPGNVRQLENMIERIVVTSRKTEVDAPAIHHLIPWKKEIVKAPPVFEQLMPLQEAIDFVEEQLITMAMDQYKSVKLAARVLDISQPTMSRKYKKIREKIHHANLSPSNKRRILEEQLDKRLRSIAIVTAAIIQPEEIVQLKTNVSPSNPAYQKLQKKLTMIQEQEGTIQWVYIFEFLDDKRMLTLVADEGFVIQPGEIYEGPSEIMEVATSAMNGEATVTSVYEDRYGKWKTSFAPITDETGRVVALIGYDYSKAYIDSMLKKMGDLLNISI